MDNNAQFLRQLSRFNIEVRRILEGNAAIPLATQQLAACEDAERELHAALRARETSCALIDELNARIARADAETQVWTLIASGTKDADFAQAWHNARVPTPVPNQTRWQGSASGNRFFSIARVRDESYRFFTISARH